ncbi:hypothetical protein AB434_4029 [Heyndrickxia coagulans]|nr:hypothetical protein AB434_4029 [Heyndrickxia coagulans]
MEADRQKPAQIFPDKAFKKCTSTSAFWKSHFQNREWAE